MNKQQIQTKIMQLSNEIWDVKKELQKPEQQPIKDALKAISYQLDAIQDIVDMYYKE